VNRSQSTKTGVRGKKSKKKYFNRQVQEDMASIDKTLRTSKIGREKIEKLKGTLVHWVHQNALLEE